MKTECWVRCSCCGKRVSNMVMSDLTTGIDIRAFVECPECADNHPAPPDALVVACQRLQKQICKFRCGDKRCLEIQDCNHSEMCKELIAALRQKGL
jgi:hypothetical protein